MNREILRTKLREYDCIEIRHAKEVLSESTDEYVNVEDIGRIAERVSVAIDHHYSDDENHPLWGIEKELATIIKASRA